MVRKLFILVRITQMSHSECAWLPKLPNYESNRIRRDRNKFPNKTQTRRFLKHQVLDSYDENPPYTFWYQFLFSHLAAEKKTSLGKDWHKFCLKCEKCGKLLTPGGHAEVCTIEQIFVYIFSFHGQLFPAPYHRQRLFMMQPRSNPISPSCLSSLPLMTLERELLETFS